MLEWEGNRELSTGEVGRHRPCEKAGVERKIEARKICRRKGISSTKGGGEREE